MFSFTLYIERFLFTPPLLDPSTSLGMTERRGNAMCIASVFNLSDKVQLRRLSLLRLDPFEALAEIFDFVAGLVQRVPKKPNEMKADL